MQNANSGTTGTAIMMRVLGGISKVIRLGWKGGINTYAYVSGNPISKIDPLGLSECDCSNIPASPPGVDIDQNIKTTFLIRARDPRIFKFIVQNKGPWNYKQMGREYGDFGNFNYGVTGLAAGFSETILLQMAGYAQHQAGTSLPGWGNPFGGEPYGDDPADQALIKKGLDYFYTCRK